MVVGNDGLGALETNLFKGMALENYPGSSAVLQKYIDLTGSQQYWDFFAPHSPKYHQYLSVCGAIIADPDQGAIHCKTKPLFSNLNTHYELFGSHRSRLYRLTENLSKLEDPLLLAGFAQYYQHHAANTADKVTAQLVLHQFELHPELAGLPKAGYRMDKLLWTIP